MDKCKSKGTIQITIGIIIGILLLLTLGSNLLSVYNYQTLTSNEELLIKLGLNPSSYEYSLTYWIIRYSFHICGLVALLLYVIFVSIKKLRQSFIVFMLYSIYSLIIIIFAITALSEEEQIRGLTIGGWFAKIIVWMPKFFIELGLLVQGLLGVRKNLSFNKSFQKLDKISEHQDILNGV